MHVELEHNKGLMHVRVFCSLKMSENMMLYAYEKPLKMKAARISHTKVPKQLSVGIYKRDSVAKHQNAM